LGQTDCLDSERDRAAVQHAVQVSTGLLKQISPLELGRSFVIEEPAVRPLMLLWKGIATYVCCNPRTNVVRAVAQRDDSIPRPSSC
jgi:hypothetical protein